MQDLADLHAFEPLLSLEYRCGALGKLEFSTINFILNDLFVCGVGKYDKYPHSWL